MKETENIEAEQMRFAKHPRNKNKKTLVIALDDCVLKTSLFKEEFPRVDGSFDYQKLKIYVCFRKDLEHFLKEA